MERSKIRIQSSNQRNTKPSSGFFSGLPASQERLKFRPREQTRGPNSSLRMKGCPSPTAPLSNSDHFLHSCLTQPRRTVKQA